MTLRRKDTRRFLPSKKRWLRTFARPLLWDGKPKRCIRLGLAASLKPSLAEHTPPSALHTMAVLQVFQAKLLRSMDESGPELEAFRDLRSATDLALWATKSTAQAIGRSMENLTVLERHLWLNLTEMKDADRAGFLDSPISTTGLFGPVVKGFAERYTKAQKASQAMRHFLPKQKGADSSADNAPSQAILEISSTPYIYEVHGRSSRPPETTGSASVELP
ncbi:hypothetical protein PO909_015439 [Leuciscus waleckii]